MAPQAAELLANFITLAETPALKTQARLDQVEVALNLNPPDLETVQAILPLLEKEQLSPEQTMQLARLNILEAESRQEVLPTSHCPGFGRQTGGYALPQTGRASVQKRRLP